jgi:hypothetical protein
MGAITICSPAFFRVSVGCERPRRVRHAKTQQRRFERCPNGGWQSTNAA